MPYSGGARARPRWELVPPGAHGLSLPVWREIPAPDTADSRLHLAARWLAGQGWKACEEALIWAAVLGAAPLYAQRTWTALTPTGLIDALVLTALAPSALRDALAHGRPLPAAAALSAYALVIGLFLSAACASATAWTHARASVRRARTARRAAIVVPGGAEAVFDVLMRLDYTRREWDHTFDRGRSAPPLPRVLEFYRARRLGLLRPPHSLHTSRPLARRVVRRLSNSTDLVYLHMRYAPRCTAGIRAEISRGGQPRCAEICAKILRRDMRARRTIPTFLIRQLTRRSPS